MEAIRLPQSLWLPLIPALGLLLVLALRSARWRPRGLSRLGGRGVLNLGHRGWPARAPENTLPSFRAALGAGAHGVELDVRLSRDGRVVVIHDQSLLRTTGDRHRVADVDLTYIQSLDAAAHFAAAPPARVPTLDEAIWGLPARTIINVELKGSGIEGAVARIIRAAHAGCRVVVSSFDPLSLARLRRTDPSLLTALIQAPHRRWPALQLLAARPDALHPHYSAVDAGYVARARRRGLGICVWGATTEQQLRRLVALGLDGIITDHPDLLARVLSAGAGTQKQT